MDKIAVISDVHGNRWALEAVLEDIQRRNVSKIINLGDSLYGPLDPAGTASILMSLDITSVLGNEDRILIESETKHTKSPTLDFVIQSVSGSVLEWLRSLPTTANIDGEIRAFHGTPRNDAEYLMHKVTPGGHIALRSCHELSGLLTGFSQKVFLCGHDHKPNTIYLDDDKLVINPGSVGLQAYYDHTPLPHHVKNGSPHARYCLMGSANTGWQIEQIQLDYDSAQAASTAVMNDRLDWSEWLISG